MKRQALRWIALVLALVMSLSLAACSSKQDTAANDTTGTPAADTAADTQTPSASDDGTNVIKIGLMLQLSGSSPADSEELLKGCQKIADIINNETDYNLPLAATAGLPNLNGAKIEIVVGDAATNDAAMSGMPAPHHRGRRRGLCRHPRQLRRQGLRDRIRKVRHPLRHERLFPVPDDLGL